MKDDGPQEMFVLTTGGRDPVFSRASGGCICSVCGKTYYEHPYCKSILSFDGHPFLTEICDGTLVKL